MASIIDLKGIVPRPAEPVSLEDMEHAIADGALESAAVEPAKEVPSGD